MGAPRGSVVGNCILWAVVLLLAGRQIERELGLDEPAARRLAEYNTEGAGMSARVRQLARELARVQKDSAAAAQALGANVTALKSEVAGLHDGLEELRLDADLRDEQHRRTQGAEPEPEPEPAIGENVKLVKREVVYCQPGDTTSDGPLGNFDYSQCADRAFATCHANACAGHTGGGKHRRAQAGDGYGQGSCGDVASRSAQITATCCDEPMEDCSGGYLHTCNAGCAAIFLPFWTECRLALGKDTHSSSRGSLSARRTMAQRRLRRSRSSSTCSAATARPRRTAGWIARRFTTGT